MGGGGGGEHGEEVRVLGRGCLRLMPRLARRNEDDLAETELPTGLLGTDQVPDVDGIEGAAHDAEPAGSVAFRRGLPAPCPLASYGRRGASLPVPRTTGSDAGVARCRRGRRRWPRSGCRPTPTTR